MKHDNYGCGTFYPHCTSTSSVLVGIGGHDEHIIVNSNGNLRFRCGTSKKYCAPTEWATTYGGTDECFQIERVYCLGEFGLFYQETRKFCIL
jgi:hypothetical protein